MPRYFLEISYHGANYAGFQIQDNAHTVQEEVEKVLTTYLRTKPELTGSSRTDAGVHAAQNFFHFDVPAPIADRAVYNLNAMLPGDIAITGLKRVRDDAHCRFDAISRYYIYSIYTEKDPFLRDRAYFYPYTIDMELLSEASHIIASATNFTSFSKRNTQVRTYNCSIVRSEWVQNGRLLEYHVESNRFLRGMVRGLVATMLRVGRGKMSLEELAAALSAKDNTRAKFDVPGHGLILQRVKYDWSGVLIEEFFSL